MAIDENNLTLVFVHLGTKPPSFLKANIKRCQSLFPDVNILIVSDQEVILNEFNNFKIQKYLYIPEGDVAEALSNHAYDRKFRQGFWQLSLVRIFALLQATSALNLKYVLHIESDILLFSNFPFETFKEINHANWLRFNEVRDVGSIIYIPNVEVATNLRKRMIENLEKDSTLTDMKLLSRISEDPTFEHGLLPTSKSTKSEIVKIDTNAELLDSSTGQFERFDGIFDAAPVGMWLCGQDPKNHQGYQIRYIDLPDSYIQPGQVEFTVKNSNLYTDNGLTSIYNLHLHSKEAKLFLDLKNKQLTRIVNESRNREKAKKFKLQAFTAITIDYLRRHKRYVLIQLVRKITRRNTRKVE